MAKKTQKVQKVPGSRVQSHLRARIAYLYQATNYLQSAVSAEHQRHGQDVKENEAPRDGVETSAPKEPFSNVARQYGSQLRSVSLKSQLRLDRDIKRSLCKRCDSLIQPGLTSSETKENRSRGGKKPWADTQVITCGFCGTQKRYPLGLKKGIRLAERQKPQPSKEVGLPQ